MVVFSNDGSRTHFPISTTNLFFWLDNRNNLEKTMWLCFSYPNVISKSGIHVITNSSPDYFIESVSPSSNKVTLLKSLHHIEYFLFIPILLAFNTFFQKKKNICFVIMHHFHLDKWVFWKSPNPSLLTHHITLAYTPHSILLNLFLFSFVTLPHKNFLCGELGMKELIEFNKLIFLNGRNSW